LQFRVRHQRTVRKQTRYSSEIEMRLAVGLQLHDEFGHAVIHLRRRKPGTAVTDINDIMQRRSPG